MLAFTQKLRTKRDGRLYSTTVWLGTGSANAECPFSAACKAEALGATEAFPPAGFDFTGLVLVADCHDCVALFRELSAVPILFA